MKVLFLLKHSHAMDGFQGTFTNHAPGPRVMREAHAFEPSVSAWARGKLLWHRVCFRSRNLTANFD